MKLIGRLTISSGNSVILQIFDGLWKVIPLECLHRTMGKKVMRATKAVLDS